MADTYIRQTLPRGDTWTLEVEFTGIDLSAWTWACQWRRHPSDSTLFTTASVDMTNAATGVVVLTVPASVTAGITPQEVFYFDVQRTLGVVVETVVAGEILVEWDVTR